MESREPSPRGSSRRFAHLDVNRFAGEVPGLEGISRAEGACGFLQSQRSPLDVSTGTLNVRF